MHTIGGSWAYTCIDDIHVQCRYKYLVTACTWNGTTLCTSTCTFITLVLKNGTSHARTRTCDLCCVSWQIKLVHQWLFSLLSLNNGLLCNWHMTRRNTIATNRCTRLCKLVHILHKSMPYAVLYIKQIMSTEQSTTLLLSTVLSLHYIYISYIHSHDTRTCTCRSHNPHITPPTHSHIQGTSTIIFLVKIRHKSIIIVVD